MAWTRRRRKPSWWSLEVFLLVILCGTAISGLQIPPLLQSGVVGVYDKSKLEASMFRNVSAQLYFHVWPEHFKATLYFCEDPTGRYSLVNFTSSAQGNILDPRPYYDVGIADAYQSIFWTNKHFWDVDTNRRTYPLRCEYGDLQALYFHRLHHKLPWMQAKWCLAFLPIFEVATFASTFIFWFTPGFIIADPDPDADVELGAMPEDSRNAAAAVLVAAPDPEPLRAGPRIIAFKWIFLMSFMDNCADVLHIDLLACASFMLIENVGHSDIRGWRPMAFNNVGVLYEKIAIVAIIAAFLRQICLAWPSEDVRTKLRDKELVLRAYFADRRFGWWDYFRKSSQNLNADPLTNTSADWRWQRVFGQGAVILLTGTLLACVEDNTGTSLDNLASLVLAAVVVACSWSVGVASVSLFRSFSFLVEKIPGSRCFR